MTNTANPIALQPEQIAAIHNALTAAANRWTEWAEDPARAALAPQFRLQAAEATSFASMFLEAQSVMIAPPKHIG